MPLKYGKFEIPNKIIVEDKSKSNTYAKIVAEPFEKGYGHTLGNALRRVMLTSIEAPAIISIAIEDVPHEYMPIEGVIEDMTNIVLNFKGSLFRKLQFAENQENSQNYNEPRIYTTTVEVTQDELDKHEGSVKIKLGRVVTDETYEVINPDLHLFTVTKPFKRDIHLRFAIGRGYVPSERHVIFDKLSNEIVIDALHSPVRMVNYHVENTRVGQDTDFDRLVFEITTDGRVSPEEALSFASQIGMANFQVFEKIQSYKLTFDEGDDGDASDDDEVLDKLCLRIDEIELSVRSTNCLSGANIETIAELVSIPDRKMLEFRNFGKKSLNEIRKKLEEMGLHLGMDLSRFGITQDNVRDKVKQYAETRPGRNEVLLAEEEESE